MRVLVLSAVLATFAGLAACSSDGEAQRVRKEVVGRLPGIEAMPSQQYLALVSAGASVAIMTDVRGETTELRRRGGSSNGVVTWIAPNGAGYSFLNGVLVETRGAGPDIMSSDVSELLALLQSGQAGTAKRFETMLDGDNQLHFHSYVCTVTFDQAGASRVAREDCSGVRTKFVNTYSILDASGMITQSFQSLGEGLDPLRFEQVS